MPDNRFNNKDQKIESLEIYNRVTGTQSAGIDGFGGSAFFANGWVKALWDVIDDAGQIILGENNADNVAKAGRLSVFDTAYTEQITLNGQDGSASFAGGFANINGDGNINLSSRLNIHQAYAGDINSYLENGTLVLGANECNDGELHLINTDGNEKINLLATNGSAIFAGGLAGIDGGGNFTNHGVTGFTGTGAFTTFTIKGGIITAAS
jgi:hypothetical protein